MKNKEPLWQPSRDQVESSHMMKFMRTANEIYSLTMTSYDELWLWSTECPNEFWGLVWDFCNIIGEKGERVYVGDDDMLKASWFPDARLNFAEN